MRESERARERGVVSGKGRKRGRRDQKKWCQIQTREKERNWVWQTVCVSHVYDVV